MRNDDGKPTSEPWDFPFIFPDCPLPFQKRPTMYRRPKFLEVLHAIREEMSREVDYDVDLFAEMVRSGVRPTHGPERIIRGIRSRALREDLATDLEIAQERPRKRAGKSG
jgi:hypothetical protein